MTHLRNERHLLAAVRHPNLIALLGSWQDEACVHLVLEYIPGGELFALMRDKGRMSEDTGRFYAAQMVLALEYLHMLGIAYRDLKPENCLLDAQGYLRLADFGFGQCLSIRLALAS